jgi:hypothetical protein
MTVIVVVATLLLVEIKKIKDKEKKIWYNSSMYKLENSDAVLLGAETSVITQGGTIWARSNG